MILFSAPHAAAASTPSLLSGCDPDDAESSEVAPPTSKTGASFPSQTQSWAMSAHIDIHSTIRSPRSAHPNHGYSRARIHDPSPKAGSQQRTNERTGNLKPINTRRALVPTAPKKKQKDTKKQPTTITCQRYCRYCPYQLRPASCSTSNTFYTVYLMAREKTVDCGHTREYRPAPRHSPQFHAENRAVVGPVQFSPVRSSVRSKDH
ncbi:hypothetical protein B0T24DRAFT_291213 [Lasiosphaeria ovina]|uniref:Uncharacterized protein n=1 Tax=Lasiosphaeria ovina TaxID=92902 RepID=A0AAE0KE47_9PEZI|nr:hypothetical protein B0T24DRAFT_291213 [Lasiosphaeria ovina]